MGKLRITATFIMAVISVSVLQAEANPKMQKQSFGKTEDGQQTDLYILTNKNGMEVAITNYGGTVVTLKVPDRTGKIDDRDYRTLVGPLRRSAAEAIQALDDRPAKE